MKCRCIVLLCVGMLLISKSIVSEDGLIKVVKEIQVSPSDVKQVTFPETKEDAQSGEENVYRSFTGKVKEDHTKMRISPNLGSLIVKELSQGQFVLVRNEKGKFYEIDSPEGVKTYIFGSFVLDGTVAGNKVNVRIEPDLHAAVVAVMHSDDKVTGASVCQKNSRWLEIDPPEQVRFYIEKGSVMNVGGIDKIGLLQAKKRTLKERIQNAESLSNRELCKSFEQIDVEKISDTWLSIIKQAIDFPELAEYAQRSLHGCQESCLQKRVAYLEAKISHLRDRTDVEATENIANQKGFFEEAENERSFIHDSLKDKEWEKVEENLYATWSMKHYKKTMEDYYASQKSESQTISGFLDSFDDEIKNKPGNYILRDRNMPVGYVYSTFVDLEKYKGTYVTLFVSSRPNNGFAIPAYFVLSVLEK